MVLPTHQVVLVIVEHHQNQTIPKTWTQRSKLQEIQCKYSNLQAQINTLSLQLLHLQHNVPGLGCFVNIHLLGAKDIQKWCDILSESDYVIISIQAPPSISSYIHSVITHNVTCNVSAISKRFYLKNTPDAILFNPIYPRLHEDTPFLGFRTVNFTREFCRIPRSIPFRYPKRITQFL